MPISRHTGASCNRRCTRGRFLRSLVSLIALVLTIACDKRKSNHQAQAVVPPLRSEPAVAVPRSPQDVVAHTPEAQTNHSAPKETMNPVEHKLQIDREEPFEVPNTPLTVRITESSHKIRAPLARVIILVSTETVHAPVEWLIENNSFDRQWLPIQGRFWNDEAGKYQEGEIPEWQVRLESIDDHRANGAPSVITLVFRRHGSAPNR